MMLFVLLACGTDGTAPDPRAELEFDDAAVELGNARSGQIVMRNTGQAALGPIELVAEPVEQGGVQIPGVQLVATPAEVPTLNVGDEATVTLSIDGDEALQSGTYTTTLRAMVQGSERATTSVSFLIPVPDASIASIEITSAPDTMRQGDVVAFEAVARDSTGAALPGAHITWSALPMGHGLFTADGRFVAYSTGPTHVVARAGTQAVDSALVHVSERDVSGSFRLVGHGDMPDRYTSDLWIHGDVAYSGTWGYRGAGGMGNTVYTWDVSGVNPVLVDSVQVDASTVNDVKISADGNLAVLTHEWSQVQSYGLTLLDMSDPLHPTKASSYIADIPGGSWIGMHNVWIDGDYVYAVVDGDASNRGLWILDVSNPSAPERVAQFWGGELCGGGCFLHDVYVRDGLAFLSHWDAGLIILDVGNGIRGGSPTNPVEVGRVQTTGGETHNAWYWPEKDYVFVGEEDFGSPGMMHVVDVSDLTNPVEVATFRVAGDTPHNFWLDEENEVLYMAWYSQGLVALDVSGELLGSLDQQGRVIASHRYDGIGACPGGGSGTCTWAPQVHDGLVYVSDMNSGIRVFELRQDGDPIPIEH